MRPDQAYIAEQREWRWTRTKSRLRRIGNKIRRRDGKREIEEQVSTADHGLCSGCCYCRGTCPEDPEDSEVIDHES